MTKSNDLSTSYLHDYSKSLQPKLSKWRRYLHQHPELGWCEFLTSSYIKEALEPLKCDVYTGEAVTKSDQRLGLPTEEIRQFYYRLAEEKLGPSQFLEEIAQSHTGVVARFETGKPGKHMAFRFDIDALPIQEVELKDHIPEKEGFRSNRQQTMHACAHDGHTAIGLGLAQFLDQHLDELTGTYTLLFQPSEEGLRGARSMVEKGWLDGVDLFLSGHIMEGELGTVTATTQGQLASTKYETTFHGRSAHAGANPDSGANAILAAAHATIGLHGISRHHAGDSRINVGQINGGQGKNIIADYAKIGFETRGSTTEVNTYISNEAHRIIEGAARMQNVTYETKKQGESISVPSNREWVGKVKQALTDSHIVTTIIDDGVVGGSEDATLMMKAVQDQGGLATYMLYHSPLAGLHHQPNFDYHENVLCVAVHTLMSLVAAEQRS
ncbi:amidohydrolase [Salipaludibacillus agaradhaerens]|uniref:Amidohydrolase n=1 Tax=Salipaludibacillus agaradhaerens TaxID=76935 RepID=A0A9Q4B4Q8_SALAG|nr:amidohydrolase [Salipaludibacillus agaradhaerens]MCR6098105.1 amidohydrolase [Salipaludibacillus agaradhaerens]MCR6116265.1 amidohydrolase [Salipaludibacillus agaradhaerens]